MKADRLILLALIAIVAFKFFTGFPLDSTSFPGGTDVAHFFTNSWYLDNFGITKWNYWWYGGFPFLTYYPPVAFLITAFIGKLVGVLVAYKFVNNAFLALDVLAFFFFVKEFKMSREKEILSTTIFSFIPIFAYFFVDGRFTTLVNVFFALLYWKFLKRSLDNKKFIDISIAAIFISISLLTHHTTTFLFIAISTAWSLIYKPSLETIKKLLFIGMLTLALTAWWSIPFFLDTSTSATGTNGLYTRAVGNVYVNDFIYRINSSVLQSSYYVSGIEPYLLIGLAIYISVVYVLAVKRLRDKTTRDFMVLSIFIVAMLILVRYERSVIFLSIPVSIVVAEGFDVIKGRLRLIAEIAFIILAVAGYLLIRPQMYQIPTFPNIPKDGRVIFFPIGSAYAATSKEMKNFYEVIFSPMNGYENIRGWHDESQLIGRYAGNKYGYILNVSDPLNTLKGDYYKLLSAGYINYVFVNNNATDFLKYFNDSKFKEAYSDNEFTVFQINPKSTYVEFNGNQVQSQVNKTADRIEIDTDCSKGAMVIKESYNDNWHVTMNGNPAISSFNDYGFIKVNSEIDGQCRIVLEFENPGYYLIFYLISIVALLFVLFNILKNF